jgi:TatD DNase family protein
MLIDTHAHILSEFYSDKEIEELVNNIKEKGIKAVLNNGLNKKTNREVIELNNKFPVLKAVLGYYPIDALRDINIIDDELQFILNNKEKIVAIGEVGLDYAYSSEKEKQIDIFRKFLKLSEEIEKPIIIHSRKAEKDVIEICKESKNKKIIMHTFSGNFKLVREIEKLGWFFSVPTALIYSSHFQKIVAEISINQIFTETDSPFMSPFKKENGEREKNNPTNIIHSIKKIAEIKKMDENEVKMNIFMNYQRVFL